MIAMLHAVPSDRDHYSLRQGCLKIKPMQSGQRREDHPWRGETIGSEMGKLAKIDLVEQYPLVWDILMETL